eukprot:753037-Hanusia_phi.AAC.1
MAERMMANDDGEVEHVASPPPPTHPAGPSTLSRVLPSERGGEESEGRQSAAEDLEVTEEVEKVRKKDEVLTCYKPPQGVWSALQGLEDDPDGAWDILRQTQIVRRVKPQSPDAPPKPDHTRSGQVGMPSDVQKFNEFLGRLPHKHKIVIAGNHDISFDTASYPRLWSRFGHPKHYDSQEVHIRSRISLFVDSEDVPTLGDQHALHWDMAILQVSCSSGQRCADVLLLQIGGRALAVSTCSG